LSARIDQTVQAGSNIKHPLALFALFAVKLQIIEEAVEIFMLVAMF